LRRHWQLVAHSAQHRHRAPHPLDYGDRGGHLLQLLLLELLLELH
jgi:hypothetical protein